MPELPEVEVVRQGLRTWLMQSRIENIQVHDPRSLRRHQGGSEHFVSQTVESTVTNVSRRGKYLWLTLKQGESLSALVMHLGMSGQLLVKSGEQQYLFQEVNPEPEMLPQLKHLKVRLSVTHPQREPVEIWFVDQRIFGGMYLDVFQSTDDRLPAGWSEVSENFLPSTISHIARDPLDNNFDTEKLFQRLRNTNTQIKRALLDQSIVSGVGNIYADEALHKAKMHYLRKTATVTRADVSRVAGAAKETLQSSLAAGGTSFDALYVDVDGNPGYFERELLVYGRENQLCRRCSAQGINNRIKREIFMKRSSYFCPKCQPRPRTNKSE